MIMFKKILLIPILCFLGSGCATKILQVTIPQAVEVDGGNRFVRIQQIEDLRDFQVAPSVPSTPSIERDLIENKNITDKSIGRMRHGIFHNALWNYTLKGDESIYSVCRNIVSSSLASSGYKVVTEGQENYDKALPLAIDVLQFWAWMQPKFNIDLHFDGELRVKSLDAENTIDVNATGTYMFSTGMAGGSAWTKVVNEGVKNLDKDLVMKLKEVSADQPEKAPMLH